MEDDEERGDVLISDGLYGQALAFECWLTPAISLKFFLVNGQYWGSPFGVAELSGRAIVAAVADHLSWLRIPGTVANGPPS